ncbi:MAG: sporulation integral membrane protein YtvI [Bacillota bacterium]
MRADVEKYLTISLKILLYLAGIISAYFILKYAVMYFAPFIAAFILSMIMEPLVRMFQKIKLGRGIATILAMILTLGGFVTFSVFAVIRIISELKELYNSLPNIYEQVYSFATIFVEKVTNLYLQLTPEATTIIQDLLLTSFDKMKVFLGQTLSRTPQSTISFITSLSGTLIFIIITMIATFFLTKDKEIIKCFFLRQFSPAWQAKWLTLKKDLFLALIGFLKAQSIILTVTFFESFIGLSIIGIEYAFLIAILVALVDILPVLGTGSVYVPWAIISIVRGHYKLGISLLVLYGVIVVVRYMVEPKVVGKQLGIHPVVALMSMFAGLKIIGVAGIILGPTLVVTIKACQHAGILPRFK